MGNNTATTSMKKHLRTLTTAMLCLAMALLVSCKKDNGEPSGGSGDTPANLINGHEYVDLGLPSGLLWATCNIGADSPEDYGYYFAWGETTTKIDYSTDTYKWCDGSSYTKYVTDPKYGTVDNKTVLEPEDDAAHVRWGGGWRMPSETEFSELLGKCDHEWTTQNGVNGLKITGLNGNSIFLPAAGYYYDSSLRNAGSYGLYWSSSLSTSYPSDAYYLYFNSSYVSMRSYYRDYGQSVRPVCQSQN